MRITISTFLVLALMLTIVPSSILADTTDNCRRVGAYIDRVENMIEGAAPLIRESGNRRAIALLQTALSEIHLARRAFINDQCRLAFNHAQRADAAIHQALRVIPNRPRN